MINSDEGLRQALEHLGKTYLGLAALRAEHPEASPEWLAVLSEGFLDHARQVQREIEDYTAGPAAEPSQTQLLPGERNSPPAVEPGR